VKILLDASAEKLNSLTGDNQHLVLGQFLTPLTNYANWGGVFAVDNGAFSGFDRIAYDRLLHNNRPQRANCLWVTVPDVVGSARRTLEVFDYLQGDYHPWPLALVAQDGIEDLPIPWGEIHAIFIGGTDGFKMSRAAVDVIRAAQATGKHTHVGRVNTRKRFSHFHQLGVDTCDGSGLCRFSDEKLPQLHGLGELPLFDQRDSGVVSGDETV
jgi:hypothetical protein